MSFPRRKELPAIVDKRLDECAAVSFKIPQNKPKRAGLLITEPKQGKIGTDSTQEWGNNGGKVISDVQHGGYPGAERAVQIDDTVLEGVLKTIDR